WTGRISKFGDPMARASLYEAAQVLLTRTARHSGLRSWAMRIAKRRGRKRAVVALARKMGVILHRMWVTRRIFAGTCSQHDPRRPKFRKLRTDVPRGTMGPARPGYQMTGADLGPQSRIIDQACRPFPTPACGGSTPTAKRSMSPSGTKLREERWSELTDWGLDE